MATDLEIARTAEMKPIEEIAQAAGIATEALSPYGRYIAKVDPAALPQRDARARLVLVTAINPTPAGEGKTTVSVALADGMHKLGKNAMLALREPSLGPVFGLKGGATGGGYAQVVPMEDINLHFTGDLHAITAANNLLCAGHRPAENLFPALSGRERPPAAPDRAGPGRADQRYPPGGRLRHHRGQRDHGGLLSGG